MEQTSTKEMSKTLSILISCHEISPYLGSECTSGWNVITRLAKYNKIILLYAKSNQFETNSYKEHIKQYQKENGIIENIEFVDIEMPSIGKKIIKVNKFLSNKKSSVGLSFLYFAAYKIWEFKVYKVAKNICSNREIDLVHHFNHISFREPGYLWKLNKPFFLGPISGLSNVPLSFLYRMSFFQMCFNIARNTTNYLQFYLSPRISKAMRKASMVYFVTSEDYLFLKVRKSDSGLKNLLDIGADLHSNIEKSNEVLKPLTILWVGRLSNLKALNLLIDAIDGSELLRNGITVKVIGDGPLANQYKDQATKCKITNIEWLGLLNKTDVFEIMKQSDILVHTSIKEAASAVILESLSAGLPVFCHDAFGMSFAINNECGRKIPLISPERSVLCFRNELEKIVIEPQILLDLKKGAFQRASELSWDSIAKTISNDYSEISKIKKSN